MAARRIPYLDLEPWVLSEEVVATVPGDWWERTQVAVDDDRVVGWLMADTDTEMGRTWWHGPFVDPAIDDEAAGQIADALYGSFTERTAEEEVCFDPSSAMIANFAERNGFKVGDDVSAALGCELPSSAAAAHPSVRALTSAADRHAVAELHDQLFPATHTGGTRLASGQDDDRQTLGLFDGDDLIGYISVELEPDASRYIDYVGVAPHRQGAGHGTALVADALARAEREGAQRAHLTVRVTNTAARRIYERLGFIEELQIAGARKGFQLV